MKSTSNHKSRSIDRDKSRSASNGVKIALVHDHLTQIGGAEMVLQAFQEIWPSAPIYTLLYDKKKMGDFINEQVVSPSFLQKIPGAKKHYQWFLPLMPVATESHNLMDYDVVISSSSALAKGVITRSNAVHVCYCHTPTRYLWSDTHRYVQELRYPRLVKKFIPPLLSRLRQWDQMAAQRPDHFIANSKNVSDRIQKYYRRPSTIIYPPVEMKNFYISNTPKKYFLTGGRLVAYKRFDVTVRAFNRLGIRLKIFGQGPELENLKKMARPNIEFVGYVDDSQKAHLYSECIAFIHPQVEDFGITAIEAMASGRPVIAYREGGACETVSENISGAFFNEQVWEALADTVVRFRPENFDAKNIQLYAHRFEKSRFQREMKDYVESKWKLLQ